jgi:DNA-directed RNA polymerase subunit alpha
MSTQVIDFVTTILENNEPLADEQFQELIKAVRAGERERLQFLEEFHPNAKKRAAAFSQNPVMAHKVAQGYYALGDYNEALKWLNWAGMGTMTCFLKACTLRELEQYDEAKDQFELAEKKGYDSFQIAMAIVETLRRKGDLDAAEDQLKRVSRMGDIRAEYHFQLGCLLDANGRRLDALGEYERAVTLDGNHTRALFALAYGCDLYGNEQKAVNYYKKCIASGRAHVSALMNLAVLYEDREEYEEAYQCIKKVLAAYPNHARARLFLKDVESSMTMYYDEDQERRVDRRNQVLQIPISDFELSVRSRNCLKKMNIRYLGDLLRITEQELLAYKNFGETSLLEIKSILTQKGLRLGQMLEDLGEGRSLSMVVEEVQTEHKNDILNLPVTELKLSVRARKALQRLNINTIGELIQCTEAELLGCKNFGLTSLQEVKLGLKEKDLVLRNLED